MGSQHVIVGRVLLHVKHDGPLAPAGDHLVKCAGKGQRFVATDLSLDGVLVACFEAGLLKEPLSLLAAVSAVAMTQPFDVDGHEDCLRAKPQAAGRG